MVLPQPTLPLCYHNAMAAAVYKGTYVPGLRAARLAAAYSQRDLHAATGVATATISELETAKRGAYPRTVRKLAKALGVAPAALYRKPAP